MIETCPVCAGIGTILQRVPIDLETPDLPGSSILYVSNKEIQVTCPNCKGEKQLRVGGEWTPLNSLSYSLLYDLVKLKARVEENIGQVTFVGHNLDTIKEEELLLMLKECSRVGKLMQEHNWVVIY